MAKNLKAKSSTLANAQVRPSKTKDGLVDKLQSEFDLNQSYINLILGALIVVVLGVLVFNYFNRSKDDNLGPSSEQTTQQQDEQITDVEKDKLPGKYTIKSGDTLFLIAQNYYGDGYKYPELVKANSISNENSIEEGQVLDIPKIESVQTQALTPTPEATLIPQVAGDRTQPVEGGTGGAQNQTVWGEKITSESYTVVEGDWLSKIAGRAYGDIMAYQKIAQANNISNPDLIEPGMSLKIPR